MHAEQPTMDPERDGWQLMAFHVGPTPTSTATSGKSTPTRKKSPRTSDLLRAWGFTPVPVDIGEFEKLECSVTCLSVLVPGR